MQGFDISKLEELEKKARGLEFDAEEEEIRQAKVFATEDEAKQREMLSMLGFDISAMESLEAEDARQAELAVNALDLQSTQVGLLEAPELMVDEYEEKATEDLV